MAGPGVVNSGIDNSTWSSHADINPTMMALLGLKDDYTPDGRVLNEIIDAGALPPAMLASYPLLSQLGQVYSQLESPVGKFGLDTLTASTRGLASSDNGTYTSIEGQLEQLGTARDALAAQMQANLDGAAFGGQPLSGKAAKKLIHAGDSLLDQAEALAAG